MNIVPVNTYNKVFESNEKDVMDEVFIASDSKKRYGLTESSIRANKLFVTPDVTTHVVSTMGDGFYTLNDRDIALPIRKNVSMIEFGKENFSNKIMSESQGKGIYIIERYNIYDTYAVDVDALLAYYTTISNITKETIDELNHKLKYCNISSYATIRFVTYISERDIKYYNNVYAPGPNLVISRGLPDKDVYHPRSRRYNNKAINEIVKELKNHDTAITIDIIDNNNPNKPYYMKVGSRVCRVMSRTNELKTSGVEMAIKINNYIEDSITCHPLDDIESLGIYKSETSAMCDGDINEAMDIAKLNLEKEKIDGLRIKNKIENKKVDNEELKLINAKQTIHNDSINIINDSVNLDISKQKLIQENIKTEYTAEREYRKDGMDYLKMKHDKKKLDADMKMMELTNKVAVIKALSDIKASSINMDIAGTKLEIEKTKKDTSDINNIVGVVKSLTSIF